MSHEDEELHVGPVKHLDEVDYHILLLHLPFHKDVLGEVEQQVEGHVEEAVLLLDKAKHLLLSFVEAHLQGEDSG